MNNKTPFDVFTWQPLMPLKTDPGQRTERSFPYFAGKQVEAQNSSDGARKGTQFSRANACRKGSAEHGHVSDSQSRCARAPSLQRAEASRGRGGLSAIAVPPPSTGRGHTFPTQTHKPCASASRQSPCNSSPGEFNYGLCLLWWMTAWPPPWITCVSKVEMFPGAFSGFVTLFCCRFYSELLFPSGTISQ